MPLGKRFRRLLLVNLVVFAVAGGLGELAFRLLWHPKYWIRAEEWLVGSGQTAAGKAWWPETTYRIESEEFRVRFRTNHLGYRARPEPPRTADPYRVAFVGDSFTEAMQVEYAESFVARLEGGLGGAVGRREVVCENFGIAATGLFDYWQRIVHDVLRPGRAPDALVLCLYPGNDFQAELPDAGFDPDGRPRRDYYRPAGALRHALTWLNLRSKLAHYAIRAAAIAAMPKPSAVSAERWWADPAVAARLAETSDVRRSRALVRAIEAECRRNGTRLVVLVVGPVDTYAALDGSSPLEAIFRGWGVEAPLIDVAAWSVGVPGLLYPRDGHLNASGHAFVAEAARGRLREVLGAGSAPRVASDEAGSGLDARK